MGKLTLEALQLIFTGAHTYNAFLDLSVDDSTLAEIYALARWGPTSSNCNPMRVTFVKSCQAKERLKPALNKGNIDKTMAAPVTAIIAQDLEFFEKLPRLVPNSDARSMFVGKPEHVATTAFRNTCLQGAYFIIAARALGLDTGPMSGFNNEVVDAAFFPDGKIKSNFLINLGYGDAAKLLPRKPRLSFSEACVIV